MQEVGCMRNEHQDALNKLDKLRMIPVCLQASSNIFTYYINGWTCTVTYLNLN